MALFLLFIMILPSQKNWQTEKVLFIHGQFPQKTIELQSEGNNDFKEYRIVEITEHLPHIHYVVPADTSNLKPPWLRKD
jgi:hypothetical protein